MKNPAITLAAVIGALCAMPSFAETGVVHPLDPSHIMKIHLDGAATKALSLEYKDEFGQFQQRCVTPQTFGLLQFPKGYLNLDRRAANGSFFWAEAFPETSCNVAWRRERGVKVPEDDGLTYVYLNMY